MKLSRSLRALRALRAFIAVMEYFIVCLYTMYALMKSTRKKISSYFGQKTG